MEIMANRLEGKVALITGGARGQGAAEARLFAKEGAKVVMADILDEEGEKLEAELSELGAECFYTHLDVSDSENWEKAVETVVARFGKIDILVNNAGIIDDTLIVRMKDENWKPVIDTNCKTSSLVVPPNVSIGFWLASTVTFPTVCSALVVMANKEYFIEKQGNFGNLLTGDPASAPRYIEARLTPLAKEALFNSELTEYIDSYDGRNKEPVVLPSKLPVSILFGAEGIAVGMSTRILPHNLNEVIKAQIAFLKNRPFKLLPDFFNGGLLDAGQYEDGNGKVRVRARIEITDEKILTVESTGALKPEQIVLEGVEEVSRRVVEFKDMINNIEE